MDCNRNNAFSEKLKEQVHGSFDRIRKALDLREKLLLRQLSVVVQQSHHVTFQFDNIKFVDNGEEELIGRIRTYGKYNIDNFNIILKDPYENEEYIQDDHDLMHKSCRRGVGDDERENPESEEIVVEFFNNKSLIKEGAEMVRESIINLALNESKELIDKSFNESAELQLEEDLERIKIDLTNFRNRERIVTDSLSTQGEGRKASVDISNNNGISQCGAFGIDPTKVARQQQQQMITKASQTELDKAGRHGSGGNVSSSTDTELSLVAKSSKQHVEKSMKHISNLTMNNSGGTINLKNVTNLTINTCPEESAVKSAEPKSPPAVARCPSEEGSPECGFYKRLITENKILRQHILKTSLASAHVPNPQSSESTNVTSSESPRPPSESSSSDGSSDTKPQRLPLTVAELRAVLNLPQQDDTLTQVLGDLFALASPTTAAAVVADVAAKEPIAAAAPGATQEHTMQIQQWLKQIISETETEPLQNAELMEFSHINN
ncbi:hypothetical protein quinque_002647 [Culex quinquefasciatus]